MLLFTTSAFAQAAAAPGQQASPVEMLVPFVLMFVIFYFFMIRPQNRRAKEQQNFLGQLKRGDNVITSSGVLGTIQGLTEQVVTLEIAPDVTIKVLRAHISASQQFNQEGKK